AQKTSPSDLAKGADPKSVKLWKQAVVMAAQADNVPLDDAVKDAAASDEYFGKLALQEIRTGNSITQEILERSLFPPIALAKASGLTSDLESKMRVGDHAAMLLLRSTFLDMMREKLKKIDEIQSDERVDAFREDIAPFLAKPAAFTPEKEPPV